MQGGQEIQTGIVLHFCIGTLVPICFHDLREHRISCFTVPKSLILDLPCLCYRSWKIYKKNQKSSTFFSIKNCRSKMARIGINSKPILHSIKSRQQKYKVFEKCLYNKIIQLGSCNCPTLYLKITLLNHLIIIEIIVPNLLIFQV